MPVCEAKNLMKEKLPQWNLPELYSGIKDPQIKKDIQTIQQQTAKFSKKYAAQINEKISAQTLAKIFKDYEQILEKITLIAAFASLYHSIHSDQPAAGAFYQQAMTDYTAIANQLLFVELDLKKISDEKFKQLKMASELKNYGHFLSLQEKWKKHRLSENEEKILNDKQLTGSAAFQRLFDQTHANKCYQWGNKKIQEAEILDLLRQPDRQLRKKAAQVFTQGLKEEKVLMTYIFNILGQDKAINDRYRQFENPEQSRHIANEINSEQLAALLKVVADNYQVVQDYYNFKKKQLGYAKLYDYDRYAPLVKTKTKINYSQAKDIVLSAFGDFSADYRQKAEEFFEQNWIDAPIQPGKQGGAFCCHISPKVHPFVLVNYNSNLESVLTLAHELGHGVHASLARKQSLLNYDWPLTVAETASIFGEMLTFNRLKATLKKREEQLQLYGLMIESAFASIFRQVSMFLFERSFHQHLRDHGELTSEQIGQLWKKPQQAVFDQSVEFLPHYDLWWSYISHFVSTPFYVYAYAFGSLLALSLYAQYEQQGDSFTAKYLDLLANGGSQTPDQLVQPFGINLSKESFWQGGMDIIKQMVDDVKSL